MSRLYEPGDGDLLYHYCSTSTLHAIATNKTIRHSDINMLNDSREVRWAYSIFEDAATRLIKREGLLSSAPEITTDFVDSIDEILSPSQLVAHPFISCFSLEPDMLSQWRAYADDGRGTAIGFDAKALRAQIPATFLRVLYDKEMQIREMMAAIIAIHMAKEALGEDWHTRFFTDCMLLAVYMTAFKHPSFAEEKEVRAVRAINVELHEGLLKFVDRGGKINDDVAVAGGPISFQVRDNHLVAFSDVTLCPDGCEAPVRRLVLGPKNNIAEGNLRLFLGGSGFREFEIVRSDTSYR
ncbi:DUF2971 domain-containing protein [Oxalobacteraceae sp. CFBP 13708]|nr:DUF2971 domain-containing protein [Oxalobacteraceae sp. CFBP 13708]